MRSLVNIAFIKVGGIISVSFLFIFILQSCHKEPNQNNTNNDCTPIPPYSLTGPGYQYVFSDTFSYAVPYFNPNNPNEIIFYQRNNTSGATALIKFNLITKQKFVIYTGVLIAAPKWGKNDWILLNFPDDNIWKIKSNGDSLTQLTHNGVNFYPEWNLDASKFICEYIINEVNSNGINIQQYVTAIYDGNGNILDTLINGIGPGCSWQHSYLIAGASYISQSVYYINPLTDSKTDICSLPNNGVWTGPVVWTNDYQNIIWSCQEGIFQTNINSKNTLCIKSSCNAKFYHFCSISPISNKIIWQRVDQKLLSSSYVETKNRLFIMNIDGTAETEIKIQ